MKKIALFVDVQNIYYTVRDGHQCHFNYSALWRQLSAEGDIVVANAYAIERNDSRQQGFQQILRDLGFNVKLKPYIQRADGSAKGDWDVGLTIDVMDAVSGALAGNQKEALNQKEPIDQKELIDQVVLLSGDGDFDLLLKRVKEGFGINTLVYGVPALTAASLIDAATEFRPIQGGLLLK